jgi:predicted TIM-barrel fold metal-dependent hydrolase
MRIDAYTHFVPPPLLDDLEAISGTPHVFRTLFSHKPTLVDLDRRVELLDRFDIDVNVLVPLPWLDTVPAAATDPEHAPRIARRANDALAAEIARHPGRFAGVGLVPTTSADAISAELDHVVADLGFAGVVVPVGPTAKRVDHPDFEILFARSSELETGIWLHPSRPIVRPDYDDESMSRYLHWQTLGWLADTSSAMERIVFSGVFERHPGVTIITHHHGAFVPLFASRMQLGWETFERLAGLPMETSISQPYIEHFKQFYADTATFGVEPLMLKQAIDFFGVDRVLFGSDTPMDDGAGERFIPNTLASIDGVGLGEEELGAVLAGNAQRLFRL